MSQSTENSNRLSIPFQPLRPHIAGDVVPRPRLLQMLNGAASLALVVAPAGFGKTTLIAQWVAAVGVPAVWVPFNANVTELHHFLAQILTAVSNILPQYTSVAMQDLLAAHVLPPPAIIAEILHRELTTIDQEFVLVLDDYQFVKSAEAHALLTAFLRLPPTLPRIVIATRHDPPLPLVQLRAAGRLVEIRGRNLNFTASEAQQFLAGSLDAPLSQQELADLLRGTEGWAVSLRLARLYLHQEQGFASLTRALEVGARHAREFLAEEVFDRLPLAIQEFLMQTAILERLSARPCAAIMGDDMPALAQSNLQWLVAYGVFTAPVDEAQEWFRCHSLLRQFALQQAREHYGDAFLTALHARAGGWFAAEGYTEEAIRHALAAGATSEAVSIFAAARPKLMTAARWLELAHLLYLFSVQQIESDAELLVAQAWFARSQNNVALLNVSLQLAAEQLDAPDAVSATGGVQAGLTSLRGEIQLLLGHLCYWRSDLRGVASHAARAMQQISLDARFARGFCLLHCVLSNYSLGEAALAHAYLDEYERKQNPDDPADRMYLLTSVVALAFLEGDFASLATTTDEMLQLSAGRPWTEPVGMAHYYRAILHYARNELAQVAPYARQVLEHRYQLAPRYVVQAAIVLAQSYQASGQAADANAVAAAELAWATANGITEMLPYLHSLQADLALRQGDIAAATARLRESAQAPKSPTQYHYTPHLAVVRLYLRENTPASLDAAEKLLETMQQYWSGIRNQPILLELQVLQALAMQARGQEGAALTTLTPVALQAEAMCHIRLFADCGLPLDPLLMRLQQRGVAPLLLTAARAAIAVETPDAPPAQTSAPKTPLASQDDLAILLTFREQEVLRLLGDHLTNQEIGAMLCISTETVKRHSISIFRKLGVKNRRAAALYARQLASV